MRKWERFKQFVWTMTGCFGPRMDITRLDESFDEFPLLGPLVSPRDEL
jgi:hypothetical protein